MNVDVCDSDGLTPFMFSVLAAHFKCSRVLLDFGANIDHRDKNGRTCMHWVIFNGLHRALEYLLQNGADWRIADLNDRTVMMWACDQDDPRCLKRLLKNTPLSFLHVTDSEGMTALHHAAYKDHVAHVKMLLRRGANPCLLDSNKMSPAHYAASLVCFSKKKNYFHLFAFCFHLFCSSNSVFLYRLQL